MISFPMRRSQPFRSWLTLWHKKQKLKRGALPQLKNAGKYYPHFLVVILQKIGYNMINLKCAITPVVLNLQLL